MTPTAQHHLLVQKVRLLQQTAVHLRQSRTDAARYLVHRTIVAGNLAEDRRLVHPDPALLSLSLHLILQEIVMITALLGD